MARLLVLVGALSPHGQAGQSEPSGKRGGATAMEAAADKALEIPRTLKSDRWVFDFAAISCPWGTLRALNRYLRGKKGPPSVDNLSPGCSRIRRDEATPERWQCCLPVCQPFGQLYEKVPSGRMLLDPGGMGLVAQPLRVNVCFLLQKCAVRVGADN
jgi:hypothetical protein